LNQYFLVANLMEINAVTPIYTPQYTNIQYKQITVTVNGEIQSHTIFTYDSNGRLIETVVRKHDIDVIL
jgi:hypothetical protein